MNKVDSFAGSNMDFTSFDKREIKKEHSDFELEHKLISFDSDKQSEDNPQDSFNLKTPDKISINH